MSSRGRARWGQTRHGVKTVWKCLASSNFSRTSSYLVLPSLVNIFPVFSSNGSTFVCTWCPVSGLCRLILGLLSILTPTVASIFPGERDQHKPIRPNSSVYERIHERGHTGGSLAPFTSGKNRGSRITDHGYKKIVFPNHENKEGTLFKNLFLHKKECLKKVNSWKVKSRLHMANCIPKLSINNSSHLEYSCLKIT